MNNRQAIWKNWMKNKPTQQDVARLAGVSRATVSYVLNKREAENAIPHETTKRVLVAIHELGYVPNQQAQHLKRQSTNRICVILPRLGIPMNDLMLRAQRHHATKKGYSIIIAIGDSHERITQLLTQVQGGLADGVHLELGYGAITDTDKILEQITGIGVPIIVAANTEPTKEYDAYWVTDKDASYEAIQYLIGQGHQKIAFFGHNIAEIEKYARYQGYIQALADNRLPINHEYIHIGIETREQAHRKTHELLELDSPPSAIFCTADINALTVIATLQQHGLAVPDDVAVIGCGNISEGRFSHPPLTTVGPITRTFEDIAILMMHRLTDKDQMSPQKILQQWNLIIREST
jgi:DNA-binding LacI/PurR family transcriptional regulator